MLSSSGPSAPRLQYALTGNKSKSRAAYQDFFGLWKDADPDIHILKEAKAEYAKCSNGGTRVAEAEVLLRASKTYWKRVRFLISKARSKSFIPKSRTSSTVQPRSTAISSKVISSARHWR